MCETPACKVEWETAIHDGPVRTMARSPHLPKLLLTVGGYSWAVWKEGAAVSLIKQTLFKRSAAGFEIFLIVCARFYCSQKAKKL